MQLNSSLLPPQPQATSSTTHMSSNSKARMSLYGGLNQSMIGYNITASPQVSKKNRRDYYIGANNTAQSAQQQTRVAIGQSL